MFPSVPMADTHSNAERRIFELLARSELGESASGFHSINLPRHEYKVAGELDFVVVTPQWLLVLEVKGGRVARRDGLWEFTDRFGEVHRNSEGPFRQAQSAMHSLRARLVERFGVRDVGRVAVGYAVVLPDVRFDISSVEWEDDVVIDAARLRGYHDLAQILSEVGDYWRGKIGVRGEVDGRLAHRIQTYLRPDFERVGSLVVDVESIDRVFERLTEEQYRYIDVIDHHERLVLEGGAGTGKTFLAAEAARRHAAGGADVAFICSSPHLRRFLAPRLERPRISVFEFPPPTGTHEVLIVDEGQDFLTLDRLAILDGCVAGGLAEGTWRFFMDSNNQASLDEPMDPEAQALLRSMPSVVEGHLTRNCRNTSEIAIQTRLSTGADIGVAMAGHGPPVEFVFHESADEAALALDHMISSLVSDDADPGSITVLSEWITDPIVEKYRQVARHAIDELALGNAQRWPPRHVTLGSISSFKGLENLHVFVVAPGGPSEARTRSLLYVAMTRARAHLVMLVPSAIRPDFETVAAAHLGSVLGDIDHAS